MGPAVKLSQNIMYDKSSSNNFRHGYRVARDILGEGEGEEDPLQNPRPPERIKSGLTGGGPAPGTRSPPPCPEGGLMHRAKRLSCRLSERASVFWAGHGAALSSCSEDSDPPPPVPRHRTQDTNTAGQIYVATYVEMSTNLRKVPHVATLPGEGRY